MRNHAHNGRIKVIVAWQDENDDVTFLSGFAEVTHEQTVDTITAAGFGSSFLHTMPGMTSATTTVEWLTNPVQGQRDFDDIREELEGRYAIEPARRELR